METLFNIDEDGALIISENSWNPHSPPNEIRVPENEFPALLALLNNRVVTDHTPGPENQNNN